MLPATCVSPSDNKRLLGGLKSILGVFTGHSDNASRSGQQIRADHSCQQLATCQHRSQLTGHRPPATAGHRSPATDHHSTADHSRAALPPAPATIPVYIYSTGLSIEKSINCMKTHTVSKPSSTFIYYRNIYYTQILYQKTIYLQTIYSLTYRILIKMAFFSCVKDDPPSPKILHPCFFRGRFGCFSVGKLNF